MGYIFRSVSEQEISCLSLSSDEETCHNTAIGASQFKYSRILLAKSQGDSRDITAPDTGLVLPKRDLFAAK